MKMHKLVKPIILSCTLAANVASAGFMQSDAMNYNFVSLKGGIVSPAAPAEGTSNLNTGNATWTAGVLVGRKIEDRFAVDLEYMYRAKNTMKNASSTTAPASITPAINSWSAKTQAIMLNFSVDLLTDNKIRPYLRAGAGISRNSTKNYTYTNNNVNPIETTTWAGKTNKKFAYQIGAGLNVTTSTKLDTQIEYMYVDHGKIETNPGAGTNQSYPAIYGFLKDHVVTIGIKYKF